MGDLSNQNNNQKSIYVLNSKYPSYMDCVQFNHIEKINEEKLDKTNKNHGNGNILSKSTSGVPSLFHCKFKTFANTNTNLLVTDTANSGNSSIVTSISNVAGSAATSICLPPATAVIQKFFNCNKLANNSNINNNSNSNNNHNNNNKNSNNCYEERDCLQSITSLDKHGLLDMAYTNNNNNNMSTTQSNSKKKCTNVKAHLIAKKSKFWQYLEEEKWRSFSEGDTQGHSENTHNGCLRCTPTTNAEKGLSKNGARNGATCDNLMSPVNVLQNGSKKQVSNVARLEKLLKTTDNEHYKVNSNNWSGNADNNNAVQLPQEQLKFLKHFNNDLYSEAAAQLWGLSCTLCDNCRCMDCQSGYFECDDWDSNSDLSVDVMDEYDEPFIWNTSTRFCMQPCDYDCDDKTTTKTTTKRVSENITKQQPIESSHNWYTNVATNTNTSQSNCMDINCAVAGSQYSKDCEYSAIEQGALSSHNTCYTHNHGSTNSTDAPSYDENNDLNTNVISTDCSNNCMNCNSIGNGKSISTQRPKQPQNNELENCAHFNELSLLDSQSQNLTDCKEEKQSQILVQ